MKRIGVVLLITLVLGAIGCKTKQNDSRWVPSKVNYTAYYNEQHNFLVEYPDSFIPQGESGNGDGQKFVTHDGKFEIWAYADFKMNDALDNSPSIIEAYNQDLDATNNVLYTELTDNYYQIIWQEGKNIHNRFTFRHSINYLVLYFIYPEDGRESFAEIIAHVSSSFNYGGEDMDPNGEMEVFIDFLTQFLHDCWWGNNLNSLLKNGDAVLNGYIDHKMDVRRYFSPGSVAKLAGADENYGFDDYDDVTTLIDDASETTVIAPSTATIQPCELDAGDNVIFFAPIESFPEILIDFETFETEQIITPYPEAKQMAVYVFTVHGGVKGLYFIETPNGWKLAFVDDSLCGA